MLHPSVQRLEEQNQPRRKRSIVAVRREGGGNTLVKVMPPALRAAADRAVGYRTTLKYIVGAAAEGMERRLGFQPGTKLAEGCVVYRVVPLPAPNQFEFRGYSNTPAGVPQINGVVLNELYPPGDGVPQWELVRHPQSFLVPLAEVRPRETFRFPVGTLPPRPPSVIAASGF